jgi:hypothetical protein
MSSPSGSAIAASLIVMFLLIGLPLAAEEAAAAAVARRSKLSAPALMFSSSGELWRPAQYVYLGQRRAKGDREASMWRIWNSCFAVGWHEPKFGGCLFPCTKYISSAMYPILILEDLWLQYSLARLAPSSLSMWPRSIYLPPYTT